MSGISFDLLDDVIIRSEYHCEHPSFTEPASMLQFLDMYDIILTA